MPRKQRFKPSRKPKPIITAPIDGNVDLGGVSAQHNDMPRPPEVDAPPAPAEIRVDSHADKAEAQ